jgi:hypothetical protein
MAPACPTAHVPVALPAVGYRLTRLRFERPAAMATAPVEGFFDGALAAGTALFGFGTTDAVSVRVGALNTRCVGYGVRGRGLLDGVFRFHASDAPGPGGASRWDPARVALASGGGLLFTLTAATTLVRWPLFSESGDPQAELPLTALQLRAVRPSTDLGCVGVAAFPGGIFDECSPSAWLTRDPATGEPFGLLEALLVVEHTRSVRLMTVFGMPTLCTFLAGADCDTALAPWPNPPDASASGRPAWRLVGNFSAVAARIAP